MITISEEESPTFIFHIPRSQLLAHGREVAQGQWSASRWERLGSKPAPCSSGQASMFGGHVTAFHVGKTVLGLKVKFFRDVTASLL